MTELRSCPFCGTAPKMRTDIATRIWCPNDQCIIWTGHNGEAAFAYNHFGHEAAAIAAWNRRAE